MYEMYRSLTRHTWLDEGDNVCDVLHEDSSLELEFRLRVLVDRCSASRAELALWFGRIDRLAAAENLLKEIDEEWLFRVALK
jgi:hypothetical protein